MMVLDQQTLTTISTVVATGLALAGYLHAIKRDLETSLTAKINDVKTDVHEVRTAIRVLEQRTFDLAFHGGARPAAEERDSAATA